MRRSLIVLTACITAACGGHTAAPGSAANAPAPPGDPTSVRYSAGTGRYRIETALHTTQEAMGQVTDIRGSISMLVSAVLTTETGNLAAAFTVDSLTATVNQPAIQSQLEEPRGKTFRATYGPRGATVRDTSATSRVGGEQMFREFLPMLPETLTAGRAWVDTSDVAQRGSGGLSLQVHSVRQHRVVGWELYEGSRALHLTTTAAYTISGSGQGQAGQMSASGNGVAGAEQFVSSTGVYLGGSASDSSNITVTVLTMGMDIPVRQTRRTSVTRLP